MATVADFAASRLGIDPTRRLSVLDWLTLTGQSVLEVTAGPVFTDATTTLAQVRVALAWYPLDVERYVLAAGWQRLTERLPMVGRTADYGDDLGSRLLSAALADDLLWLAFVACRRWPPYAKWRGTMLQTLPVADDLTGLLSAAVTAPDWRERENALTTVAEALMTAQRARGLPAPASAAAPFWNRPYRSIDPDVPDALLADITDPHVARLPRNVGSIEQWVHSTDVLANRDRRSALQIAYRAWIELDRTQAEPAT